MKIIAVGNMKGGVGKTTTTILLADTLSAVLNRRVLALDLDPQANLSWALMGPTPFSNHAAHASMTRWLEDTAKGRESTLAGTLEPVGLWKDRFLRPSERANLQLSVSTTKMRFAEMRFEGPADADPSVGLTDKLRDALARISANFDYCVLDCSPALSALTRAGLRLADAIFIPTPLNALCFESQEVFRTMGIRNMLDLATPIYVVRTRVGAAMGRAEQNAIITRLIEREADGVFRQLSPDFVECVDYMRALNPPELGPHKTLKAKYGDRIGDLVTFGESLKRHGIVQ
jgi:cellulose biosynthesis protein BcsQ